MTVLSLSLLETKFRFENENLALVFVAGFKVHFSVFFIGLPVAIQSVWEADFLFIYILALFLSISSTCLTVVPIMLSLLLPGGVSLS